MADTDQIREWYHEGVVLNHNKRGQQGYTPKCNHSDKPKVGIPNSDGGLYFEPVHPLTVEAWEAYVMVMNHHGETITGDGGINACRNIGDTDWPSLHAYLCALDSPPNSRKSHLFITDIEKIRTNNRPQVFRNLAGDRMHDQINCSPSDLATGIDWNTVVGHTGDDMPTAEEIASAVWQYSIKDAPTGKLLHTNTVLRIIRNDVNWLKNDHLKDLEDDELQAIADAVADEVARRLAE